MLRTFTATLLVLLFWSCVSNTIPSQIANAKPIVILMGGQSNMTGSGDLSTLETTDLGSNIVYHNFGMDAQLRLKSKNFGPEYGLAEVLNKAMPNQEFIFIKYSIGGSSLLDWAPEYSEEKAKITKNQKFGNVYRKFCTAVDSILDSKDYVLGAMFWMQGERDARIEPAGNEYYVNFKKLISAIRRDFKSPKLPILFGQVNPPLDRYVAVETVRQAQSQVAKESDYNYLIFTDDLEKLDDQVHYSSKGLWKLGERFGNELVPLINQKK